MGYNTNFSGQFDLDKPLTPEHKAFLNQIAGECEKMEPPAGSIIDDNEPDSYCDWVPTEDGTGIEWNGAEKFSNYVDWIEYLVSHFLQPWGYVLNGQVDWIGDASDDRGMIYIKDNKVEAVEDELSNPGPSWNKAETVTISRSEYDDLKADARFLEHLKAKGVDNWEGYSSPDDEYVYRT
jgi:hypothetical protein